MRSLGRLPVGLGSSNKIQCHKTHLSLWAIKIHATAATTGSCVSDSIDDGQFPFQFQFVHSLFTHSLNL